MTSFVVFKQIIDLLIVYKVYFPEELFMKSRFLLFFLHRFFNFLNLGELRSYCFFFHSLFGSLDDQVIDGQWLLVFVLSHVVVNEVLLFPRLLGLVVTVAEVVVQVTVLLAILISIVVMVNDHSAKVFIIVFFLLLLVAFVVPILIVMIFFVFFVLSVVHVLIVGLGLSCL